MDENEKHALEEGCQIYGTMQVNRVSVLFSDAYLLELKYINKPSEFAI